MLERPVAASAADIPGRPEEMGDLGFGYSKRAYLLARCLYGLHLDGLPRALAVFGSWTFGPLAPVMPRGHFIGPRASI